MTSHLSICWATDDRHDTEFDEIRWYTHPLCNVYKKDGEMMIESYVDPMQDAICKLSDFNEVVQRICRELANIPNNPDLPE